MKRITLGLVIFFAVISALSAKDYNWQIYKSTHFIIHYKSAKEDFIHRLADRAEKYYDKIADALGFRRYNFWLWDNRANIYIYDDIGDYQAACGQPSWSAGTAMPKDKVIQTNPSAKDFFDTILPHEMGHIIFREFVGFDNQAVPVWLDEGVASYSEGANQARANNAVRKSIKEHRFISIEDLSKLNPYLMKDNEGVSLFYAEATSIIDYLVKRFGKDKFVLFCQVLRDRKDLERALSYTYPFSNIRELSLTWQGYLNE